MKRIGLIIVAMFCLAGSAFAACESPTDKLKSGTVAFMCPPEPEPQVRVVVPAPQANVSVVEKVPDAIPGLPAPASPAEDLEPEKVGDTAAATPVPAEDPAEVRPASAKPEKKAKSKSKSKKKTRTAAKKPVKPKSGKIIHLEKPSLGRRIVQFFGG